MSDYRRTGGSRQEVPGHYRSFDVRSNQIRDDENEGNLVTWRVDWRSRLFQVVCRSMFIHVKGWVAAGRGSGWLKDGGGGRVVGGCNKRNGHSTPATRMPSVLAARSRGKGLLPVIVRTLFHAGFPIPLSSPFPPTLFSPKSRWFLWCLQEFKFMTDSRFKFMVHYCPSDKTGVVTFFVLSISHNEIPLFPLAAYRFPSALKKLTLHLNPGISAIFNMSYISRCNIQGVVRL